MTTHQKLLGRLTSLTNLDVRGNAGLVGSIPPSMGNLTRLSVLLLDRNSIGGSLPSSLGLLSRLTMLYLYENAITG